MTQGQVMQATAGELAAMLEGRLEGLGDLVVTDIKGLDEAGPEDLTFISSGKWAGRWADSNAMVALVSEGIEVEGHDASTRALIVVPDANLAMIAILRSVEEVIRPAPAPGVHATAIIDDSSTIGEGVHIGPHVVIEAGVHIGAGTTILANTVIERHTRIGERCHFGAGCVIGGVGYGIVPHPETGELNRVPHLGNVEIGDDVEIGAGSCVDRGKFGPTVVGTGTKTDNLVQIGHNVRIDEHVIIGAQCGIGGSTHVKRHAMIGARVGIAQHMVIGEGAQVAGSSNVIREIPDGIAVGGTPAIPIKELLRELVALRKLPALIDAMKKANRG